MSAGRLPLSEAARKRRSAVLATACSIALLAAGWGSPSSAFGLSPVVAPQGGLPDNRAYELVTPPETNGALFAVRNEGEGVLETEPVRADGGSVIFNTQGLLLGMEGNGKLDAYQSVRSSAGWITKTVEPSGAQAVAPSQGGTSKDHGYSSWEVPALGGSLVLAASGSTVYVRKPDGTFELAGKGDLGMALNVQIAWISDRAGHIIFSTYPGSAMRLEENSPAEGIAAIYDRSIGGDTEVVSLLPGNVIPSSDAILVGVSEDGSTVIFSVEGKLYERSAGVTKEVAGPGAVYAGASQDGSRVFYRSGGNIFAFLVATGVAIPIGSGGESTIVNISADGSTVYFSSPEKLNGSAEEPGARNLYVWHEGDVRFIGVLDPADFEEFESYEGKGGSLTHLGEWLNVIASPKTALSGLAREPSRTSPDGSAFVFQSHGISTFAYDSEGHAQIYLYMRDTEALSCLSCPSSTPTSDAQLQSTGRIAVNAPLAASSILRNVTDDGSMVFFESRDPLVPGDTDGIRDVYEWRAGQVNLISSGRSESPNYLYGVTPDGHDVVFRTGDRLVPQDETGGSGSIYDARINGGFPAPPLPPPPCAPDANCQGQLSAPPSLSGSVSLAFTGPETPAPARGKKKKRCHKHNQNGKKHCHGAGRGSKKAVAK